MNKRGKYSVKVLALISLSIALSFCSKDFLPDQNETDFITINPASNEKRITELNQYIPLRKVKSGNNEQDETLAFNLRYMVEAPAVNGTKVQASHLSYQDNHLYLSYNTAGEIIRGAYEVITLSAQGMPSVLTGGATTSEYHSVDVAWDQQAGVNKMMLAGVKLPVSGGIQSIVQIFELNAMGFPDGSPVDIPLSGVVATDVNHFGVVTGTMGGFHEIDGYTANRQSSFEDARSIAYYANKDQYLALLGQPGRLALDIGGNTQYINVGGMTLPETKAMVRVHNDLAFTALGDGGLKVINLITGETTASLDRPNHPVGENESDYVTNSVSVNAQGLVFIANGAAGIYVARLHNNNELELLGYLDMDASVNHVEAAGNYLFAACGDKGVAIIELAGIPEGVPLITTDDLDQSDIESQSVEVSAWIGNILSMEMESSGIAWGLDRNPTTETNTIDNGTKVGDFKLKIENLEPSTIYYARAYVVKKTGEVYYGNQVIFKTLEDGDVSPSFVDNRDEKRYKMVTIGTQTWMAENLAYLPDVSPAGSGSTEAPYFYVNDYNGFIIEEAKQKANYLEYGVLYNWSAAQSACPDGWHLPTDKEWNVLETYLGMSAMDAAQLRFRMSGAVGGQLKSTTGWYRELNGSGSSGFSALPAGYREKGGSYKYTESFTAYWSADEVDTYGVYRGLYYFNDGVYRGNWFKSAAFSVRCIKN